MLISKNKKRIKRSEAIVFGDNGNIYSQEQYNKLRDNILYYAVDGKNVIQVESSVGSEGKTTTVANLAVCLGTCGKKVLVIDMDFAKSRLHRTFCIENSSGLGDYIVGKISKEEMIKKTQYENVSIINSGCDVAHSSAFLTSNKMKELISELKKEYDFVLIDCAPVLLVSNYLHISRITDGTLFVVAYGLTKKKQVSEAMKLLKSNNVEIIGSVFTFYNPKISNKYSEYNNNSYSYYGYRDNKKSEEF